MSVISKYTAGIAKIYSLMAFVANTSNGIRYTIIIMFMLILLFFFSHKHFKGVVIVCEQLLQQKEREAQANNMLQPVEDANYNSGVQ